MHTILHAMKCKWGSLSGPPWPHVSTLLGPWLLWPNTCILALTGRTDHLRPPRSHMHVHVNLQCRAMDAMIIYTSRISLKHATRIHQHYSTHRDLYIAYKHSSHKSHTHHHVMAYDSSKAFSSSLLRHIITRTSYAII